MRRYCVVYVSGGFMRYRFRCYAKSKAAAKRECRLGLGITNKEIVDVYEED